MSSETTRKRYLAGIGTRLTLWGAGLTTLLIAVVSAALYAGMFYSMRSQIDAFLEGEIHEFMLTVNEHPNDDEKLQAYVQKELGVRSRNDLGFRLIDQEGTVLVSSAVHDDLRGMWRPPAHWALDAAQVVCETLQPPANAYPHRVCSLRVQTADGRVCTAQSSYLLDQMMESLARVRRIGLSILVLAPLIAVGLGGFLARRSLQPVRKIMASARAIGAHDLRARVPLSGAGDEMDQLAETLNGMLERIEKKVQEVQRFTSDASHELRTPLAALRGHAEIALSRPRSNEELRQGIEESVSQYERLQRIAEDLLLLARLDAGDPIVKREPVLLNDAVADVVDLYLPGAEEKGIELTAQMHERLVIAGDGGRLRQVIGNLIDNAIKFTPQKGHVSISAQLVNGCARVQIRDDGVGIPAVDLPRVFDRFYRTDPSRSAHHAPGTGLGLSICRSIVEAHGGHINIESAPCEGTSVSLVIPVCRT